MKPYKIVKSDLFKKQEKELSKKDKKMINDKLKTIAKDPANMPGSMELFGEPSVPELKQWMDEDFKVVIIDLLFEYLKDKGCLTKKGEKLYHDFWKQYIWEGRRGLMK